MKKGYFAVWFNSEEGCFESTENYPSPGALRKNVDFFDYPRATGHVVIFYCDGKVFYPVEETWMPETNPKLNWRTYQTPE